MEEGVFNDDFIDFLVALNDFEVEYILVGGYAVILHGNARTTGDIDVWVNPVEENFVKLLKAFIQFGLPSDSLSKEKFLDTKTYEVFSYGRPPIAIDIMTSVKGLSFDESFKHSKQFPVGDIKVNLIDYRDLIATKQASGRHKDLDDIEKLNKANSPKN